MRRALLSLVVLLITLGTSSCLLVEPPSGHMSPPIAVDDFCTRFAQTTCDGFDACCDDPAIRARGDRTACVQTIQTHCTSGTISISTAIHDPRTGYDPFVAGAVIGTMQDYIARCDPSIMVWSGRRDGFDSLLQGTVANGNQCLNGNPLTEYPALLSCDDFSQACILSSLTSGNCNARHTETQGCVLDFDCADGLYCGGPVLATTCQPRLADGAACGSADGAQHHSWCRSSFCFAGRCEAPNRTDVYCGGGAL